MGYVEVVGKDIELFVDFGDETNETIKVIGKLT